MDLYLSVAGYEWIRRRQGAVPIPIRDLLVYVLIFQWLRQDPALGYRRNDYRWGFRGGRYPFGALLIFASYYLGRRVYRGFRLFGLLCSVILRDGAASRLTRVNLYLAR